ncbi:MAG: calcium-binding protein, partial [Alphaproteobacteria bacterium]
ASYAGTTQPVNVNLKLGVATTGAELGRLSGIEKVVGGDAGDLLVGDANANTFVGGAGDDVLVGRAGADVLIGGAGSDTASYAGAVNGVTVNLGVGAGFDGVSLDFLSGIENVTGGDGNDTLTGGAGANVLEGGAGNDLLDGGAGGDTLIGGAGNDALDGGAGSDTASYEDAASGVVVNLGALGAQNTVAAGTDTLVGIENLIGGDGNDTLTGDGGANALDGSIGDDTILGGAGDDVLLGNFDNDTLTGESGTDQLTGGPGLDVLRYTALSDGDAVATDTAPTTETGDFVSGFVSGADGFQFATSAFGDGVTTGAIAAGNFATIATDYDGTNSGLLATTDIFVFEANADGGGTLYYDEDTAVAGYTVVATLDSGTVAAADIVLV